MMGVQVAPGAISFIQWEHIDGPLFYGKDGYLHWLTLRERIQFKLGLLSLEDLEKKYNHSSRG